MEKKRAMIKGETSIDALFQEVLEQIDKLPRENQENKRHEYMQILTQAKAAKLELDKAWKVWLASPQKGNPGKRTIEGYEAIWKRFYKWLQRLNIDYVHEVTPKHARDYCANLWKSGVSPSTYNAHHKFLRSMFKSLQIEAGLVKNAWSDIRSLEKEQESRRDLSPEELARVCSTATGNIRYMIALGLYTGMRLGDVCSLKWSGVDLERGIIEHMPLKTQRKKKKVRLPIHPVLDAILKELRAASTRTDYLFPKEYELYSRHTSNITKKIQRHFMDCGIKTTEKPPNDHRRKRIVRVGFHSLRHSFVSLCAANRVPQVAIQELVGHGSPAMTALYSHAGDEQKAKAIAGLPAIDFENGTAK